MREGWAQPRLPVCKAICLDFKFNFYGMMQGQAGKPFYFSF